MGKGKCTLQAVKSFSKKGKKKALEYDMNPGRLEVKGKF